MTQRERVLKMLQDARADGERGYMTPTFLDYGVTTAMFLDAHLPRAQARIHELRAAGWPITTTRLRPGSYLYTLTGPRQEAPQLPEHRKPRRWTLHGPPSGAINTGITVAGFQLAAGETVDVVEVLP